MGEDSSVLGADPRTTAKWGHGLWDHIKMIGIIHIIALILASLALVYTP